ncbi:hypothetical protein HU200_051223 [Digitaria exilis]|uniref:non-specific serine/threonine protein kinase n=1 Tax=Digitaria exilis TaxID=1010633 RepID=A0A835E9W5_9POAL|nr:hypothetical protein HU200_051223 [Digitaria exilis]
MDYSYSATTVLWSANRDHLLQTATLNFTADGDLLLQDIHGNPVWSTNTSGQSVAGITLTDSGNLVLFDHNNHPVWQSFDHPTDCLLPGQRLVEGMRLTPNTSATEWSASNLFYLTVLFDGLYAFAGSSPPQPYYHSYFDVENSKQKGKPYVSFTNRSLGSMLTLPPAVEISEQIGNTTVSFQFLRFESDGHLRLYEWKDDLQQWSLEDDVFKMDACGYPSVCGDYGVCSNGQCICPVASDTVSVRRRLRKDDDENDFSDLAGMPTRFDFKVLKVATQDFSNKLGQGGFGSVFEGLLHNERVAVKCLDRADSGRKEFLAEVQTIGSLHHINLVRLIGFCAEKSYRLLVFEYMPRGSLDMWIYKRDNFVPLDWHTRRKIITDIARGLSYLHEDCRQRIAHLDIKPQNILLDENFNAKIADFGLAKMIDRGESHVMTRMRGTPGYMAPEWLTSQITEKVDVYSFGIVVMEIISGRKNLDYSQDESSVQLIILLQDKVKNDLLEDMIDRSSDDMHLHKEEVIETIKLAMWCLQSDKNRRPEMSTVVKVMEGERSVESNLDYNFFDLSPAITVDISNPPVVSVLSAPR